MSASQKAVMLCGWGVKDRYSLFAGKTVLPYLNALKTALVFKGAIQMSRLTLRLTFILQ